MHAAAHNGHIETIRVLKELGADVNTLKNDGATPVHVAAHNGHAETIRVLRRVGRRC